jgi:hypothetical protein
MGAVTTERNPISGCRVLSLGVMRYVSVAVPAYVEQYLREGFTAESVAVVCDMAELSGWTRLNRSYASPTEGLRSAWLLRLMVPISTAFAGVSA